MSDREPGLDDALVGLTDDARRIAARDARRRRSDRRVADELSSTFTGTLTALAERGDVCVVQTRAGSMLRGQLVALADRALVVEAGDHRTLVADRAVIGIRTATPIELTDRTLRSVNDIGGLIERFAPLDTRVAALVDGGQTISGRLRAIGGDQLVLTLDGDGDTMTVPIDAIDELTLRALHGGTP